MTLSEYLSALVGKRVAVVGAGVSNVPLIRLLLEAGVSVSVHDRRSRAQLGAQADEWQARGAVLQLGAEYLDTLDCDVLFRAPSLLPVHPALMRAAQRGVRITSEMEAFFAVCPCRTIAVTGSDGKTTTSTLIAETLRAAGRRVHLGGNIGRPLLSEVPDMRPEDAAVLELSSFQLHSMDCRPDTALITNLSPNHLDIHPDLDDYITAKKQIFRHQRPGDCLVLNREDPLCASFAAQSPGQVRWFGRGGPVENGVWLDDGVLWRAEDGRRERLLPASEIRLPGEHNVSNCMAAFAAVQGLADAEACRAVARSFGGVEHRIELVRVKDGVSFYNDSIASSPSRTIAGLRAFDKKLILIAGGHDKHLRFDGLAEEIVQRVKRLYLMGETAQAIAAAVYAAPGYDPKRLPVTVIDDFRQAVLAAAADAEPGDTVLLSPACSSFDHFRNFEERGNTFKSIVNELEHRRP